VHLVQWLRGGGLLKCSVLEMGHLGRGGAPSDIVSGAVGGMAYCESFMSVGIRHSMFFLRVSKHQHWVTASNSHLIQYDLTYS
jgi:hypothetical protein